MKTITIDAAALGARMDAEIYAGEALAIEALNLPEGHTLAVTLSGDRAAVPVVELRGAPLVVLTPADLQPIEGGSVWQLYTWQVSPDDDRALITRGQLSRRAASAPLLDGATPLVLANLQPPAIAGVPHVGQVLAAVPGAWTIATPYAYQWTRDGVPIEGETGQSYTLTAADLGAVPGVDVTATSGSTAITLSAALPVVADPAPAAEESARIAQEQVAIVLQTAEMIAGQAQAVDEAATTIAGQVQAVDQAATTIAGQVDITTAAAADAVGALAAINLESIAATKGINPVAFCIDASPFPLSAQVGRSWFAELGPMPATRVVIAEADRVTICDGDDPALPEWLVANRSTAESWSWISYSSNAAVTGVAMLNGVLCIASDEASQTVTARSHLAVVDFARDRATSYRSQGRVDLGSIANRNAGAANVIFDTATVLSHNKCLAVAMTVLPDAPIDPASGLPRPTIAVGVGVSGQPNGGTCIIRHDGTVVDIIASAGAGGYACQALTFTPAGQLVTSQTYNNSYAYIHVFDEIPDADIAATNSPAGARTYPFHNTSPSIRGSIINLPQLKDMAAGADCVAFALGDKLSILYENQSDASRSGVAYIASQYSTGIMFGDVKGTWINGIEAGALDGSELVANGTFDADTDWTKVNFTITGGVAVPDPASATCTLTQTDLGMISGQTYVLEFDVSGRTTGNLYPRAGSYTNLATLNTTANGHHAYTFTRTNDLVQMVTNTGFDGVIDNVSIRRVLPDRSVNGNPLTVEGTNLSLAPVATGAELCAVSGFNNTSYLWQPYNPDLDFGTDEFAFVVWLKHVAAPFPYVISIGDAVNTNEFSLFTNATAQPSLRIKTSTLGMTHSQAIPEGQWSMVSGWRKDGRIYLAINDRPAESKVNTEAMPSGYPLRVGAAGWGVAYKGSIALLRIGATVPTPEQIARSYRDDLKRFQPGSQDTLGGTSDVVNAVGVDPITGLRYIATPDGLSTFSGLQRVGYEAGAVTKVAAYDGMVMKGSAS